MRTSSSLADSQPTVFVLPPTVTGPSMARACRDAWRVFVQQSQDWGRPELVLWNAGLYTPIARQALRAMSNRPVVADDYASIDARFAERMICAARAKTVETLWSFARLRSRIEFSHLMRAEGNVTRCVDRHGETVFVPTPVTDRLVDRILALVAADLLTEPRDFEGETLCSNCGGIVMSLEPCCLSAEMRRESAFVPAMLLAANDI